MTLLYAPLDGDTLHAAMTLDAHCFPVPWGKSGFLEIFREREHTLIEGTAVTAGRQLVAFMVAEHRRDRVTVLRLAVDPRFRRRGIAGELLSTVERLIPTGRRKLGVWVPAPENSAAALGLLLVRGYEGRGIERNFYGDSDAWVLSGPTWMVEAAKARTRKVGAA